MTDHLLFEFGDLPLKSVVPSFPVRFETSQHFNLLVLKMTNSIQFGTKVIRRYTFH